jgi:hypothetical protein
MLPAAALSRFHTFQPFILYVPNHQCKPGPSALLTDACHAPGKNHLHLLTHVTVIKQCE